LTTFPKNIGHTRVASVRYSVKNGFTNSTFILPNRSQCVFRNWSQNPESIEGGEVGTIGDPAPGTHNIGIWWDEEAPLSWVTTGLFRCLTRASSNGIAARTLVSAGERENCNPYALIDATFLTSTAVLDDEELWLFEVFVVLETHAH